MKCAAIIIFALMASCSYHSSSPPTSSTATQSSPTSSDAHRPSTTFPLPKIQTFGQETLYRYSYTKMRDESEGYPVIRSLPPWKWARLSPRFEEYPSPYPDIDNKVTVIPLGVDIPPIVLRIVDVHGVDFPIKQEVYHYAWEAELEPITQPEFLEYNKDKTEAFDVVWVYPSVEFALSIPKDNLTEEMLPEGVDRNTVSAAIDLTNDRKPDLLMVRYCIDPPTAESLNTPPCLRRCFKKYMKAEGKWEQIENFWPC